MITAGILAGGRARRFEGRLKAALRVGDQTIVERQLDALGAAGIGQVLIVGAWPAARQSGVHHVADAVESGSSLGGLYTSLLMSTSPIVIVLAGDMPFVQPALLRRLMDADADDDAVVPRTADGWHPLCASYRRRVAPAIKARLDRGAHKVADALEDLRVREVTSGELAALDPGGWSLTNVNTPDEHRRADRRARGGT